MTLQKKIALPLLAILLAGCTATERTVLTGATVGGLAGASIGAGVSGNPGGALVGGAVGAAGGAVLAGVASEPRNVHLATRTPGRLARTEPQIGANVCSYVDDRGYRFVAACPPYRIPVRVVAR